jgi:subtilisin family serine protease
MNSALFRSVSAINTGAIENLSFISEVKLVKAPAAKSEMANKLDFIIEDFLADSYDRPVNMLNGIPVHSTGYTGKGVLIAVLDGGFLNADKISSIAHLKYRSGIKSTRDFVLKSDFVYAYSSHGTAVLSTLAGQIPFYLMGTAPGADYLLLRTEDGSSEFPVEEDFWAAGAEYADSAGADIISTSLGYSKFDIPSMNYKFSDLDGNTAFVTKAADIAASKGIIVVASAGNERTKEWLRIIAPSDGDSVIAAGAVDGSLNIAAFSSAGPSADDRIKPDLSTMGVSVPVQVVPSEIGRSSGTSFSCPVLSGMIACLKEAVPGASQGDIINSLRRSADRYNKPDSLYGYGIPDIMKTLIDLQESYLVSPENGSVAWPNPTTGKFEVTLKEPPASIIAELFTSTGTVIFRKNINLFAGRTIVFDELYGRDNGIYLIRIITDKGTFVERIIKISN